MDASIVEALQKLANAFTADGCDFSRLTDALEQLADCVREDANGNSYFCISSEID